MMRASPLVAVTSRQVALASLLLGACHSPAHSPPPDGGVTKPLVARPDVATTVLGAAVDVAVLGNDDAAGAKIASTTKPAYGTVTVAGGKVTYLARAGFVGTDSFVYSLARGTDKASARVEVTVRCSATANGELSYDHQKSSLHVSRQGIRTTNPGTFVNAIAYLDFDGDGLEDVFIAGGNGTMIPTPVELYRGRTPTSFLLADTALPMPPPGLVHPRKAFVSDFNGDGKPDLFVAAHGYDMPPFAGEPPLALLSTTGGYSVPTGLAAFSGYHHGGASADIDGDGDIDVFLTTDASGKSIFLVNDGSGGFTLDDTRLSSDLYPHQYYTAELLDVDGDCHVDLMLSGHEFADAPTRILWGDGSGTFSSARATILPAVAGQGVAIDLDAEDLDGDGDRDVVVTRTSDTPGYQGYYLQAIENRGNRTFADVTTSWLPTGHDPTAQWIDWIHLEDVDGDGAIDLVADDAALNLEWLNDGSGHLARR